MNNYLLKFLLVMIIFTSCAGNEDEEPVDSNFRQEMREFVIGISNYAKQAKPGFVVIPQNGIELVSTSGDENGQPQSQYLDAIDANGQEDLFYGYENDDQPTSENDHSYLRSFLNISKNAGKKILVTDYCSTLSNMDDAYTRNKNFGYVSFAANHRELNNIPSYPDPIYSENDHSITSISEVQNFLYLINPEQFATKTEFIQAVSLTNYDLIIMDLFTRDGIEFTNTEINTLKTKANGGSRLVIAYMSVGEAENYRYYWVDNWNTNKPVWLDDENPDWAGNFKVRYWNSDWQKIIYGTQNSYLQKILDANFDGVYLDLIDAFEYFE